MRAVQRELYEAERSTLVADADGEPARELSSRGGSSTTASTASWSCPSGRPAAAGQSIAEEVATVTIGDALPG